MKRLRILHERREDVAAAMRGLTVALGGLSLVRNNLDEQVRGLPPESVEQRIAVKLHCACNHLSQAVADLPTEFWAIMLEAPMVGGHELQDALNGLLSPTTPILKAQVPA